MKVLLLLGLGLMAAGLAGCAVQASVPGASFAVAAPGPVVVGRPYYGSYYRSPRAYYRPAYVRRRHYCDDYY